MRTATTATINDTGGCSPPTRGGAFFGGNATRLHSHTGIMLCPHAWEQPRVAHAKQATAVCAKCDQLVAVIGVWWVFVLYVLKTHSITKIENLEARTRGSKYSPVKQIGLHSTSFFNIIKRRYNQHVGLRSESESPEKHESVLTLNDK